MSLSQQQASGQVRQGNFRERPFLFRFVCFMRNFRRRGGIAVHRGDLIFADVDGTVVVPQDMAEETINKAWEKVNGESKVRAALSAGTSIVERSRSIGYFEQRLIFVARPARITGIVRSLNHLVHA